MIPKVRQERGKGRGLGEPDEAEDVREGFCCYLSPGKMQRALKERDSGKQEGCGYSKRMPFCFAAKFTEFPRNVTATEGQNVEMSCAFQSGSASVYLEIQWWFLRGPEEMEPGAEGTGAQVAEPADPASSLRLPRPQGVRPGIEGRGAAWAPLRDPPGSVEASDPQGFQGGRGNLSWGREVKTQKEVLLPIFFLLNRETPPPRSSGS